MARGFDGTSGDIAVSANKIGWGTSLSWSGWIRSDAASFGGLATIWSNREDPGQGNPVLILDMRGTGNKFPTVTVAGSTSKTLISTHDLTVDALWHYCMITYADEDTLDIYIDDMATVDATVSTVGMTIGAATGNITLAHLDGLNREWEGELADIKVWDVKLNEGERHEAKAGGIPSPSTLLSYYALNGSSSTIEPDLSGNGNHLTLTGTTKVAHAPTGPYVLVPLTPALAVGLSVTFSATIAAVSTVAADISRNRGLSATIPATSTVGAAMAIDLRLAATIAATSLVTADMTRTVGLQATIDSISILSAAMSVAVFGSVSIPPEEHDIILQSVNNDIILSDGNEDVTLQ